MFVVFSGCQATDSLLRNSVVFSDSLKTPVEFSIFLFVLVAFENLKSLCVGQRGVRIQFTARLSVAFHHIGGILGWSSKHEMSGIHTAPIVAGVPHQIITEVFEFQKG